MTTVAPEANATLPMGVAVSQPSAVTSRALDTTADPIRGELEKGTRLLAIVGDQSILYGDIAGQINEMLAPYEGQVPEEELNAQKELLIQRLLPRIVDNKILYLDFLRQIPGDRLPEIEQQIFQEYNKKRLPKVLEETGLQTAAELDEYLRSRGSSLAKQQRLFLEQVMRHEAVRANVEIDKEVSHEEMVTYYREQGADFEFQARARWEQLMVCKSKCASHAEAHQALVDMGNEVLRGAPLDAVARRGSQGPNAAEGGQYDWTNQGSLVSEQIDQLIFALPVGKLSRIVESDDGYHIIRVIERVDAGKQTFAEAQEKIKEKINERRFEEQVDAYLARLREETYVWMATDEPAVQTVTPAGYSQ